MSASLGHPAGVRGRVDALEQADGHLGVDLGRGLSSAWPSMAWMNRMSAPPSSISVAIVCRNMWQDPFFPTPDFST